MKTTVAHAQVSFAFDPTLKPVARVQQGEEALLETHDCFEG